MENIFDVMVRSDDVGCEVTSDSEIFLKGREDKTTHSDESEDENVELIPETRIRGFSAFSVSLLSDKLLLRRLRATTGKGEAMSLEQKSIKISTFFYKHS